MKTSTAKHINYEMTVHKLKSPIKLKYVYSVLCLTEILSYLWSKLLLFYDLSASRHDFPWSKITEIIYMFVPKWKARYWMIHSSPC